MTRGTLRRRLAMAPDVSGNEPGGGYDYDPSGAHQLLTSRDEGIWRRSDGEITRIPEIGGAHLAVW